MCDRRLELLAAVVVGTTSDQWHNVRGVKLARLIGGVAIALLAMIGTASAYTITAQSAPSPYAAVASIPFTLLPLGTSSPQSGFLNSTPISQNGETITFQTAPPANPGPTTSGLYVGNPIGGAFSPFGSTDFTHNYLVAGDQGGTVTMTFATPQTELNLLWGTVDYFNQNVLSTISVGGLNITGLAIYDAELAAGVAPAGGVFGTDSIYNVAVEIKGLPPFTQAVAQDAFTSPAFEFVPGAPVLSVPEPTSLVLLGTALLGLGWLVRKEFRHSR